MSSFRSVVVLGSALEYIRRQLDVPSHIFWQNLEDAGISPDTNVHLATKPTTIGAALQQILSQGSEDDVTFDINDGVLLIATNELLCRRMELHVYDISRLALPRKPDPGQIPNARLQPDTFAEHLKQRITNEFYPDSWLDTGGPGTIVPFGNCMVIRNNPRSCRAVTTFLQQLRPPNEP